MDSLINEWRWQWGCWVGAETAGAPIAQRNRLMDTVRELARQIAGRPELHEQIEALCASDVDAETRVRAALVREHWDQGGAAETFESVVVESGIGIARPVTMAAALAVRTTTSATTAALCLLNIDAGRGNVG